MSYVDELNVVVIVEFRYTRLSAKEKKPRLLELSLNIE